MNWAFSISGGLLMRFSRLIQGEFMKCHGVTEVTVVCVNVESSLDPFARGVGDLGA